MSVKSFKFVSPGVFVNEVDNSQLPRLPEDMGPVIIGRAERGPAMVPVKIDSFSEFVETFGEPIAGAQADDAWRQGNRLGPTYGAFAAQAYLKNGSPITFVRLLGEAHPDVVTDGTGSAGWNMAQAYGIFVDEDGDAADGKLAAVIYTSLSSVQGDVVSASMVDDDIKLTIGSQTPAILGSTASQTLIVNEKPSALGTSGNEALTLHQLDEPNGSRESVLQVTFDNTTSTNTITGLDSLPGSPGSLVVGTGNVVTQEEFARAIAAGINEAGSAVRLSATPAKGTGDNWNVVIACDDVGLLPLNAQVPQPIIEVTDVDDGQPSPDANHDANVPFTVEEVVQGSDFVSAAGASESYVVNFDRGSKKYIRSVLNTNPVLTNDKATDNEETYFLGATFDQFIEDKLSSKINDVKAIALGDYHNHLKSATAPSTPWVSSQYLGSQADLAAPLASGDVARLFRFHSLYSGEWEQRNLKISIVDIKPPSSDFVKYGTFSVLIRSAEDSDASPVIYERYSNVNLDPTSPRYIAAVIGDIKMEWRDAEKRYIHVGEFLNQSRFIRVETSTDVASGAANPELLPFSYVVPSHPAPASGDAAATAFPAFYLRENTEDSNLSSPKDACFGVSTSRPEAPGRHDESYQDIVRLLNKDEEMISDSGELFSLDNIQKDKNHAKYAASSYQDGTSFTATVVVNTDDEIVEEATYARVLDAGYDKFTLPLVGGFDGLDITKIEPFCDAITSVGSSLTSYAYNSISKAIDIVSDPEVVECNLMAIPGVATPGLTGKLIATCEARGDALAVIDLENDYTPRGWETTSPESQRLPDVSRAVGSLKSRGLSSSYGCAFFPWVQVSDDINNRKVWMPPSVVALGTMASSAAKSELWFAPAGFTRGGLSAGAGGLPVSQVRMRLSSKERDALYEANINPIAQFPAEGIVVFGQKTLQVTPSALDRINVRRLMIHVKKEISRMAATTLFDQNVRATWNRFLGKAEPFLASVQTRFGLTEYKIILDETTTTPDLIDRNVMYAKVFLKPARAIEFIAIDFVITNTGASFDD